MAQRQCLSCYRKHIATGSVLEDEAEIGNAYPTHKWLAIGEYNAAAKEIRVDYPILAQITREHTLDYQNDEIPFPAEEMIEMATELEENENKKEKEDDLGYQI